MRTAQLEKSRCEPKDVAKFAFAETKSLPETSYSEWFREEILPSRWLTYFVAFIVHWFALLTLAAIYIDNPIDFASVTLNAVFCVSEPQDGMAMEILGTVIDVSALEDSATTPEASAMSASTLIPKLDQKILDGIPDSLAALALSGSASGSAFGSADGSASGSAGGHGGQSKQGGGYGNAPGNAVSAGSFSVWTEPDNPDPGEPYKIVVQIRLPDGMKRYSVTDLEGVVVGSDGYQKLIPGNVRGFLPVHEGQARFEVHIVSADENVLDTVFVRSKVLREAQKLQLRF